MTGRGDGRLIRPSPNAIVTIGLTLNVSPPTLSLTSPSPFYITVTARILDTPHPSQPITLQTHPNPLERDCLFNRSFNNIVCTSDPDKHIELWPLGWPQYHWDPEDLRSAWEYMTIPARDQGSEVTVKHEVPRQKVEAAGVKTGERYKVSLTDKCLGARWWAFAGEGELERVRLRAWRAPEEEEAEAEEERGLERDDPELYEEMMRERREKYADGPLSMGEEPDMLAMVVEVGEAEFEVV
ncbi:MAG: hypothetical protein M1831_004176 [Alyxoria varia]|nr:MAG: hypothetical protein M1831_004176 [Alyxoria varia]